MNVRAEVPDFFVYGEPSRALEIGFLHVERVRERETLHYGHVAPHRHPLMGQITYWFRGGGTYRIEDCDWEFSAPAISFVPSNVVHGFDVGDLSDAIVVSVSDDRLRAIAPHADLDLDVATFASGSAGASAWKPVGALLEIVAQEYRERGAASEKLLSGLIGSALSLIGRAGGNAALPDTSPSVALGFALRRAVDLNYRHNWPVGRYVEMLATTPHLLDRATREVFGRSVKAMVMERRLLEAKRLLLFTIRSVEDVGREIGFDDPAYFSRFFRLRTGLSPTEWRRHRLDRAGDAAAT